MIRTIFAIALAPGVAAAVYSTIEGYRDNSFAFTPLYFILMYVFTLLPAAGLLYVLKNEHFHKLWHYLVASLLFASVCTALFVTFSYRGLTSLGHYVGEFLGLWPLLVAGLFAGGASWLIQEAGLSIDPSLHIRLVLSRRSRRNSGGNS